MPTTGPHKIFQINEILEAILLETDIVTLLVSCQRLCRHWHAIIQESPFLQAGLFFHPSRQELQRGVKRTLNPFITEILWPKLLAKYQYPAHKPTKLLPATLAKIKSCLRNRKDRNLPLLRKEASWRRMLLQQPPSSTLAITELETSDLVPWYYEIAVRDENDRGFLRMGHVFDGIKTGVLIPDKVPLLVRYEPIRTKREEKETDGLRRKVVQQYLLDCDLAVFSDPTLKMLRQGCSDPRDRFEGWYRREFGDSYWAVVDRMCLVVS